jgi:hypothetical protein
MSQLFFRAILLKSNFHTPVGALIRHYYYYYLLQFGFHPVAVVLTLVHTIQMFSPGDSSPYTSTHNTNGHIIYIKITIQNKLYTITKQNTYSKYKYTLVNTSTQDCSLQSPYIPVDT